MDTVPSEILQEFSSHLDFEDLCVLYATNKKWHSATKVLIHCKLFPDYPTVDRKNIKKLTPDAKSTLSVFFERALESDNPFVWSTLFHRLTVTVSAAKLKCLPILNLIKTSNATALPFWRRLHQIYKYVYPRDHIRRWEYTVQRIANLACANPSESSVKCIEFLSPFSNFQRDYVKRLMPLVLRTLETEENPSWIFRFLERHRSMATTDISVYEQVLRIQNYPIHLPAGILWIERLLFSLLVLAQH
jgi:hypothetical protein